MIETLQKQDGIWQIERMNNITFLHADNMDFLRWCKSQMMYKYFHISMVDPPYGINVGNMKLGATSKSKPRNFKMGTWDSAVPTEEYWDLLDYVSRDIIVWGGNYFVKELKRSGRCFYVWDKKNNGMSFADCELALTTFDANARIIPKSRNLSEDDGDKRHPTHKPQYVYDYLHLQHETRGKKILDTHGGSFSHAVAAFKNGAKLTIMDKDESYFKSGLDHFKSINTAPRLLF